MTNGDRLRKEIAQKSNDELVKLLLNSMCSFCIYDKNNCAKQSCKEGIKEWFDVPCEGEPQQEAPETVNHPKHYNRKGAMECIREMVVVFGYEATINFC